MGLGGGLGIGLNERTRHNCLIRGVMCLLPHTSGVNLSNRGFHVGDAQLGGVKIFDACLKIQHDAQWSVLTQASIF